LGIANASRPSQLNTHPIDKRSPNWGFVAFLASAWPRGGAATVLAEHASFRPKLFALLCFVWAKSNSGSMHNFFATVSTKLRQRIHYEHSNASLKKYSSQNSPGRMHSAFTSRAMYLVDSTCREDLFFSG